MKEDPVDESPSSISTGDKGNIMGDSRRDFRNGFSSTLIVSLTVIVLTEVRSGRDRVCTICIPRGDMTGDGGQSLLSFRTLVALGLSGFLRGTDGG